MIYHRGTFASIMKTHATSVRRRPKVERTFRTRRAISTARGRGSERDFDPTNDANARFNETTNTEHT